MSRAGFLVHRFDLERGEGKMNDESVSCRLFRLGLENCRGRIVRDYTRVWIDNTRRFFQPPITTRMTTSSSVVVKQIVLFTMLHPPFLCANIIVLM